jgi:hypothetical protein
LGLGGEVMAYQPRWTRGTVTQSGDRSCKDRYDVIRVLLSPYTRQITVWDLGASLGYFGLRLASDLEAVSVMVDARPDLVNVVRENALPTTIAMTHRLSVGDLDALAASEAPDVVLALNVLHHFDDWRGALDAVLALGDRIIIETPGRGDVNSANYAESMRLLDALEAMGAPTAAHFPSHVTAGVKRPMFLIDRVKDRVSSGYAYVERVRTRGKHPVRAHRIHSDFETKWITYDDGESRAWEPGMNLWNWAQMGGVYPSRASVQDAVRAACEGMPPHGDLKPWNVILQGQMVRVIDAGHRQSVDDAAGLANTLEWIARPEAAYV